MQLQTNMQNMNTINMMSMAMSAVQNDGPSMEAPASLTPPPASMYDTMNSVNPQQQQQQQQMSYPLTAAAGAVNGVADRDGSPTPPCILMDENILLDLLPADGA